MLLNLQSAQQHKTFYHHLFCRRGERTIWGKAIACLRGCCIRKRSLLETILCVSLPAAAARGWKWKKKKSICPRDDRGTHTHTSVMTRYTPRPEIILRLDLAFSHLFYCGVYVYKILNAGVRRKDDYCRDSCCLRRRPARPHPRKRRQLGRRRASGVAEGKRAEASSVSAGPPSGANEQVSTSPL